MDGASRSTKADWAALLDGREDSPFWTQTLRQSVSAGDPHAQRIVQLLAVLPAALGHSREAGLAAIEHLCTHVLDLIHDDSLAPSIDVAQATLFWTNRINGVIEAANLPLRLRKIYPNDRFDHDSMESVSSVTGHHLTVSRALTWTVVEEGDERSRVVQRGKVVTS